MEGALGKIRPHTSSSLPHQKSPANLLIALESTFKEQGTERSSTAYFAALLTTLEGTLKKKDLGVGDGDLLPAELYLLALVAPFVPHPILRSHLSTILTLTTALFHIVSSHAPALRSLLGLHDALLRALDRAQLDAPGVRQSFVSILQLCLDPRPKVRKKGAEVVRDVLSSPPTPLMRHPYGVNVATWICNTLATPTKGGHGKENVADPSIHVLALLRSVLHLLPPSVSIAIFVSAYMTIFIEFTEFNSHCPLSQQHYCNSPAQAINTLCSQLIQSWRKCFLRPMKVS